jgi:PAS domain S-box-containing protein
VQGPPREGGEWFEAVAESVDRLLFVTEPAGRMLWVNEHFRQVTGYGPEDFQFENPDNPFLHRDDLEQVAAALATFAASEARRSEPIVNRFIDRWGGVRWIRSVVNKVSWEGAPALLFVASAFRRDGEKEMAFRESEERYRSLVDNAEDGIVHLDREGRLHFANRRMQELVGLGAVALGKAVVWELVHPDDRERVRAVVTSQATARFQARLRSGPDQRWVDVNARRLAEGENAGLLLAIVRDVTEAKRLEAERRHGQKLESLGVLAGGIAHDYNNLMTAVLGNVTLAQTGLEEGSPAWEPLADARVAAERAGDLSRSMLAYLGQAPMERTRVDLAQVVKGMQRLLRSVVVKHIGLELSASDGELPFLGDANQVQQVILNLVSNAADAIGDAAGHVRVEAGQRACEAGEEGWLPQAPAPGTYQSLVVEDDGCGVDPRAAERMFDPFFSTKGAGRGLGLSSALGILRSHGGALRLESEPGQGARFELLFPPSDVAPPQAEDTPTAPASVAAGTVLFVDDELLLRRLGQHALEAAGYEVRLAASGEAAAEACEDSAVVAVVLDRTMPGMGGDAAFEAIRAARPALPVLLTSGFAWREDATDHPRTAFLPKPYTFDDLVEALARLLREAA